jgi:uncharacterized protein (DUF1330 family)
MTLIALGLRFLPSGEIGRPVLNRDGRSLSTSAHNRGTQRSPVENPRLGGKYLARGGRAEALEGDWSPNRIVFLEFESSELAKQWLDSPEYQEARTMRLQATRSHAVVVEGV